MKYLLPTLLLISCVETTNLGKVCPKTCWPESLGESSKELGVCVNGGVPVCDENNDLVSCQIPGFSYVELCDGLDNNCNGATDENLKESSWRWDDTLGDNPCGKNIKGICRFNKTDCVNGRYVCEKSPIYEEVETLCDSADNDCDGIVDEEIVFDPAFCYDGDFYNATNPPCRPGYYSCVYGEKTCVGQVLPEKEMCDEVDNDCNSVIDDTGKTLEQNYDIIFNIDVSQSMCKYINAVSYALANYTETFNQANGFKFGIVIMNDSLESFSQGNIILDTDLSDFNIVKDRLPAILCDGSALEPSLNSINNICDIDQNPLDISWRSYSKKLIYTFTDEDIQSYSDDPVSVEDVINECSYHTVKSYTWSKSTIGFEDICDQTGGKNFGISQNWEDMFKDMNSILQSMCIDD